MKGAWFFTCRDVFSNIFYSITQLVVLTHLSILIVYSSSTSMRGYTDSSLVISTIFIVFQSIEQMNNSQLDYTIKTSLPSYFKVEVT